MKEITVDIVYSSNEYILTPDSVTLTLDEKEIDKIKIYIDLAKLHDITICMDTSGDFDINDDTPDDFIPGYECIKIYPSEELYYYAQSKYDAGTQIESKGFRLNDIK